ncbi:MAG TPA: ComEA family DNA-binding protein [Dehalococcoidia bacterium]|nr:ComEA family DNA-binding protein [Dehalococcoidia bacterium]
MTEILERWRWPIVGLICAPLLVGVGVLFEDEMSAPEPLVIETAELESGEVKVYITGAVANPGVYQLEGGLRWIDALEAAGGPTEEADLMAVNLSRRALDEDHIVVPFLGGGTAVAGVAASPLVNINAASQSELEELPGIGEVRADRIIQSRTVDGPFGATEDIVTRELVPNSVYEDIAELISVY